jgi:hypothetical protein
VADRELLRESRARLGDEERRIAQGRAWAEVATEQGGAADARRKRFQRAVGRISRKWVWRRRTAMPDDNPPPPNGDTLARRVESLWQRGKRPDADALLAAADPRTPAEVAEALAIDQWHRWHAGQRLPAEDYLARHPAVAADPAAALALVYGEFLVREDLGETPTATEYLERFPGFAAALRQQFGFHAAVAAGGGSTTPSVSTGPAQHAALPSLPGYELLGELGRGGMGIVYKARDTALNRTVAIKMLLAGTYASEQELARFLGEAEAIARLEHPGIVQIFHIGRQGELPYFVMEFCEGGSLASRIDKQHLPPRKAAEYVEALAKAVAHAHADNVIHRDLKPENVLFATDGTPKVTDFGLAKRLDGAGNRTQSGAIMGTPSYMAPEQAAGEVRRVGPLCDVWAIGGILYRLLGGRPPFEGETPYQTICKVLTEEPTPLERIRNGVPRDLAVICLKCLEKDPAKRYAGAAALAEDLRRWLNDEPIQARPAGRLERTAKWVRRNRGLAAGLTAAAVALLAGTAASTYFAFDAAGQAELARDHAADAEAKANAARESAAIATAKEQEAKDSAADAKAKERAVRRMLGEFSVAKGVSLEEQGDLSGALLWFAEARRRDPDNADAVATARLRLAAYRRYAARPTLVQVFDDVIRQPAFSPDGRRVLTAGLSGARVWDAATGQPVTPPLAHQGGAPRAAFSPNGRRVVTAGHDEVRV